MEAYTGARTLCYRRCLLGGLVGRKLKLKLNIKSGEPRQM